MSYLNDSMWVVAALKGTPAARDLFTHLTNESLAISLITYMRCFALIRGDLRNRGELIGDPDILIAATTLHYNLTLVTENVRHFQRIAGLSRYQ